MKSSRSITSFKSLDGFIDRAIGPSGRHLRGGRLAAVGLITGGLTAIPVNFLVGTLPPWDLFISLGVVAIGISFLFVRWEQRRPEYLYLVALFGTALIAFASTISSLAFAINYGFIVMAVAVTAPLRITLFATALTCFGLTLPVLFGPNSGVDSLPYLFVGGPALLALGLLAYLFTRTIERSRGELWRLARQDELTGVGNFRALTECIDSELARHRRHGAEFCVLLLDLDRFKAINDCLGHLHGDQVLARVGRALNGSIRLEDRVFRQGGDEFAVVAPHSGTEDLEGLVDRLVEAVSDCSPEGFTLGASVGIASYPDDGDSASELLARADRQLMQIKQGGRAVPHAGPVPSAGR